MFNVLFLCTGNSARSIMAEALLNHVAAETGQFKAYSAGSFPKGKAHPLALEALAANHLSTEGYRSKSWDEFSAPGAPHMDFVFTVCDQAASEVCPVGLAILYRRTGGVQDPAAVEGDDEDKRRAFSDALRILRRRIDLFANLPLDQLEGLALKEHLDTIGRDEDHRHGAGA